MVLASRIKTNIRLNQHFVVIVAVIKNRNFVEQDTLKKLGLGRETTPIEISELKMDGTKKTGKGRLPKLEGVEVEETVANEDMNKTKISNPNIQGVKNE